MVRLYGSVYKIESIPEEAPKLEGLLYFSDEEAYLVNSLIDRLSSSNSLKKGLKEKLAVIYDSTAIDTFVDERSNATHVERLSEAAKKKKQVTLKDYESGNSHTIRDRWVEPFGFTTDYVDVWAYDIEDGKNKIFKVSRIGEGQGLDSRKQPQEVRNGCFPYEQRQKAVEGGAEDDGLGQDPSGRGVSARREGYHSQRGRVDSGYDGAWLRGHRTILSRAKQRH